jgi:hypothetical protein
VAAHDADVGLDPVPLQAAAVAHPVIGGDVLLVGRVEALGITIEGVGVLHDELAGAQDTGARAGLVALLDLKVVEDERKVAVGLDGRGDVGGDDLLMGEGEDKVGAAPVLELEQLIDLVAPGLPPWLGRLEDRHEHLLAADGVHLLADDLHDPLVDAPPRRQPGPQPGADLADEPGADHELVGERLGVGRRFALGGQEVGGKPGHAAPSVLGAERCQRIAMF